MQLGFHCIFPLFPEEMHLCDKKWPTMPNTMGLIIYWFDSRSLSLDINRVSSFFRCLNGTFPPRNYFYKSFVPTRPQMRRKNKTNLLFLLRNSKLNYTKDLVEHFLKRKFPLGTRLGPMRVLMISDQAQKIAKNAAFWCKETWW